MKRIKGRVVNPNARVPGGAFEQLVNDLQRQRAAKIQRKRSGFGPDAPLFISRLVPKKKPRVLFFGSSRG